MIVDQAVKGSTIESVTLWLVTAYSAEHVAEEIGIHRFGSFQSIGLSSLWTR
jgi:hypothetical protein